MTPVLLIAFNRPDLTQRVFSEIRDAKPERFFFFVDAPRSEEEAKKVNAVKQLVRQIDWPCARELIFPEKNLGHTYGPVAAINRIFEASEEAIIFEDDCLPHPTFFRYASEMLEQYRNEPKVWSIAGGNYLNPNPAHPWSCWFTPLTSTWGWASWRRSWRKADFTLSRWPELRKTDWLKKSIGNAFIADDYAGGFNKVYASVGTPNFVGWDYCFNFSMLLEGALDARPAVNLVSNIGFRADASHTKEQTSYADFPVAAMPFPLRFPSHIEPSIKFEVSFYKQNRLNYHPWRYRIRHLPLVGSWVSSVKQRVRSLVRSSYF
ncbi:MAG: hypothetical protein UY44_C0005G0017 [Candidatus Kaiserbacteria bacterium GW2011_GWA2_49_19]|uniref:Hemolytic protein HlpA-like protein n=1 Tax=Candidatus Kaiserbacteria bacterium GW2011_GWA2_49_19 TaxID=1618669 RepID=A0A0G1VS71_9BACT|nr:MAG: hypothetical protein UY44_C0005G0017 [Candidatus Kaiserbacteria bacterium GW2011_GWA2_49_19]